MMKSRYTRPSDFGGHGILFAVHRGDQFLDRHGAEEIIAGNGFVNKDARRIHAFDDDAFHALAACVAVHAHDLRIQVDFAAHFLHLLGNRFPQLAGAEFRVEELADKARLGIFLADVGTVRGASLSLFLAGKNLLQRMDDRLRNREALDALSTPVRANLAARYAPHLLGVVAEERAVEFHTEAVDHEVFEATLLAGGQQLHLEVAHANLEHAPQPEVTDGIAVQAHRIIEKLAQKEDAAEAATAKHHVVRLFGVGAAGHQRDAAPDGKVVLARGTLQREYSLPPVHYGIALAKETVAADIHAVPVITCSTGNSPYHVFGFKQDGLHVRRTQ